jgi:tRNA threonylcarbamoyladenosine biosynthesis protein TsaE
MLAVCEYFLTDENDTLRLGDLLAEACQGSGCIYLKGELGTGKTTLSRAIVRHFGYQGAVKSPTFTLVEPYELPNQRIYHFDLYRLADPAELEFLGVDEYFSQDSLCLVEWPEKGAGYLPAPDLVVELRVQNRGRTIKLSHCSELGELIVARIKTAMQTELDN